MRSRPGTPIGGVSVSAMPYRSLLLLALGISLGCATHGPQSAPAVRQPIPGNLLPSDAAGVPHLIERLRSLGDVPETGNYAAADVRFSVLDRLRVITNQDAGRNARDWDAWYERSRHKSQEDWIREGFLQQGLPYSNPVDISFATALLRLADWKPVEHDIAYRRTTAMQVLGRVSLDELMPILRDFAESPSPGNRRAVLSALHERFGDEAVQLLRPLARDSDVEIAENALRMLNENLRRVLPRAEPPVWRAKMGANVDVLGMIDPGTAILLTSANDSPDVYTSEVVGFDIAHGRILWSYPLDAAVAGTATILGNRIYFVDDERVAHCLSTRGQRIWKRQLPINPDVNRLGPLTTFFGEHLFASDVKLLHAVAADGTLSSYEEEHVFHDNLDRAAGRLLGAASGGTLLVIGVGGVERRVDTGVQIRSFGARDGVVCVTGRSKDSRQTVLQCLDAVTFAEQWRVPLPEASNGYEEVVIDDGRVYALAQNRIVVFRAVDGRRLWADNGLLSSSFDPFGDVVAVTSYAASEWRDAETGETIARMPDGAKSDSLVVLLDEHYLVTTKHLTFEPRVSTAGLMLARLPEGLRPPAAER